MNNEFHKYPLILKSLGEDGLFTGYASVYNVQDNHNDIILNGAFNESLSKGNKVADVKLLWQHDVNEPIGIFTKIIEDETGLYVEGKLLNDVARAQEALALMQAGALDGLSIGFTIKDYEIDENTGTRIIFEADLWEVSLVTFPANSEARVQTVKAAKSKKKKPSNSKNNQDNDDNCEISKLDNVISTALASLK